MDPLFGTLHSSPGPDHATFHWIGYGIFPPTGEPVDYQFDAPKGGPTEGQRDLVQRIHLRYTAELLPKVLPLLQAHVAGGGTDSDVGFGSTSFRLVAIWVPPRDEITMEWDLTFEETESEEQFLVDLRGWTPLGVAPA